MSTVLQKAQSCFHVHVKSSLLSFSSRCICIYLFNLHIKIWLHKCSRTTSPVTWHYRTHAACTVPFRFCSFYAIMISLSLTFYYISEHLVVQINCICLGFIFYRNCKYVDKAKCSLSNLLLLCRFSSLFCQNLYNSVITFLESKQEWQIKLFSPHFSQPWYSWLHLGHKLGFGLIKLIRNKNVENQLLYKIFFVLCMK